MTPRTVQPELEQLGERILPDAKSFLVYGATPDGTVDLNANAVLSDARFILAEDGSTVFESQLQNGDILTPVLNFEGQQDGGSFGEPGRLLNVEGFGKIYIHTGGTRHVTIDDGMIVQTPHGEGHIVVDFVNDDGSYDLRDVSAITITRMNDSGNATLFIAANDGGSWTNERITLEEGGTIAIAGGKASTIQVLTNASGGSYRIEGIHLESTVVEQAVEQPEVATVETETVIPTLSLEEYNGRQFAGTPGVLTFEGFGNVHIHSATTTPITIEDGMIVQTQTGAHTLVDFMKEDGSYDLRKVSAVTVTRLTDSGNATLFLAANENGTWNNKRMTIGEGGTIPLELGHASSIQILTNATGARYRIDAIHLEPREVPVAVETTALDAVFAAEAETPASIAEIDAAFASSVITEERETTPEVETHSLDIPVLPGSVGLIESASPSFETAHSASSGGIHAGLQFGTQFHIYSGQHLVWKSGLQFDLSALPKDARITGATLTVQGKNKIDWSGLQPDAHVVALNPEIDTVLQAEDFNQFGNTSLGSVSYADFSVDSTTDIALDPAKLSALLEGNPFAQLGLRTSQEMNGVASPTNGNKASLFSLHTGDKAPVLRLHYQLKPVSTATSSVAPEDTVNATPTWTPLSATGTTQLLFQPLVNTQEAMGAQGSALTLNGATWAEGVDGQEDTALHLGYHQSAQFQSNVDISSGNFTIEADIKIDKLGPEGDVYGDSYILSSGNAGEIDWIVNIQRGTGKLGFSHGGHTFWGKTSLETDTWHRIAVVHDDSANVTHLYVNGELDATIEGHYGNPCQGTAGDTITIGNHPLSSLVTARAYNQFHGSIGALHIQDAAIEPVSPMVVTEHYSATKETVAEKITALTTAQQQLQLANQALAAKQPILNQIKEQQDRLVWLRSPARPGFWKVSGVIIQQHAEITDANQKIAALEAQIAVERQQVADAQAGVDAAKYALSQEQLSYHFRLQGALRTYSDTHTLPEGVTQEELTQEAGRMLVQTSSSLPSLLRDQEDTTQTYSVLRTGVEQYLLTGGTLSNATDMMDQGLREGQNALPHVKPSVTILDTNRAGGENRAHFIDTVQEIQEHQSPRLTKSGGALSIIGRVTNEGDRAGPVTITGTGVSDLTPNPDVQHTLTVYLEPGESRDFFMILSVPGGSQAPGQISLRATTPDEPEVRYDRMTQMPRSTSQAETYEANGGAIGHNARVILASSGGTGSTQDRLQNFIAANGASVSHMLASGALNTSTQTLLATAYGNTFTADDMQRHEVIASVLEGVDTSEFEVLGTQEVVVSTLQFGERIATEFAQRKEEITTLFTESFQQHNLTADDAQTTFTWIQQNPASLTRVLEHQQAPSSLIDRISSALVPQAQAAEHNQYTVNLLQTAVEALNTEERTVWEEVGTHVSNFVAGLEQKAASLAEWVWGGEESGAINEGAEEAATHLRFHFLSANESEKNRELIDWLIEHHLNEMVFNGKHWVRDAYEVDSNSLIGECKWWVQKEVVKPAFDIDLPLNDTSNSDWKDYKWNDATHIATTVHQSTEVGELGTFLQSDEVSSGDIVQYLNGNGDAHTLIVGAINNDGVWVFDSNYVARKTPAYHFISLNELNESKAFTIYRLNQ